MDADQKQQSSSVIKRSNPRLIVKFKSRNINQQQQQQCSSSKEAEVVVVKNMSVSKSISNNSDSSLFTCSICGKSFPSKQSLFGHMRSHPDREYRGIQPPPPPPPPLPPSSPLQSQSLKSMINNSSPSSTGSDDSCKSAESHQGVGPLPVKWSATGRRGRQPYGSFVSSDQRLADAVKGLLMLKEGNDLDVAAAAALMNKQISRETEGIDTSKKRIESLSSEEERSSKKIKIDEERSFSQLVQQLPSKEDCGLVKNSLKKLKLDERIGCSSSSSMFDPKLINNIMPSTSHEQFPHGDDFSLVENASKKVKLCPSTSSSSHVPHMPQNGSHSIPSSSSSSSHVPPHRSIPSHVPPHSSIPSSSSSSSYGIPHMPMPLPNGYFGREFNSGFIKPSILKATTTNKKKVGSSSAAVGADQAMGLQRSSSTTEFKCHTCNRKFPTPQALGGHMSSPNNCKNNSNYQQYPTHDHQYLLCRESMNPKLMTQAAADHEHPKIPTTSYGTHKCELCGETFATGQALGGHKRRHYTGYSTGTATAPVEKLIKKEMMNSLSVVDAATAAASSSEVISTTTTTTTTTTTKTENKPPRVLDFDLNELPDEVYMMY